MSPPLPPSPPHSPPPPALCPADAPLSADRLYVANGKVYYPNGVEANFMGFNWGRRKAALSSSGAFQTIYSENDAYLAHTHYPGTDSLRIVVDYNSPGFSAESYDETRSSYGYLKQEYIDYIDDAMRKITGAGMYAIISLRVGEPMGMTRGLDKGSTPCDGFITNSAKNKEHFIATWRYLANRYRALDKAGLYELASEPHICHTDCTDSTGASVDPHVDCSQVVDIFEKTCDVLYEEDPRAVCIAAPSYSTTYSPDATLTVNRSQFIMPLNWWLPSLVTFSYHEVHNWEGTNVATTTCGDFFGGKQEAAMFADCRTCGDNPGCAVDKSNVDLTRNFTLNGDALYNAVAEKHAAFRATYPNVPIWLDQTGVASMHPLLSTWGAAMFGDAFNRLGYAGASVWSWKGTRTHDATRP